MTVSGDGFSVETAVLRSHGAATSALAARATTAAGALGTAPALDAALGPIGASSGFTAAHTARLQQVTEDVAALGTALDVLGTGASNAAAAYEHNDTHGASSVTRAGVAP